MSASPLASGWYHARAGSAGTGPIGPVSWEELWALSQAGQLAAGDLVWHPALPAWTPAEQVAGLLPAGATAASQPFPPGTPAAAAPAVPGLQSAKAAAAVLEFESDGRVKHVTTPEGTWVLRRDAQSSHYSQQAGTLLHAAELLKKLDSIPGLTYCVVETPDGSLGRDKDGYYTERPLKTKGLAVEPAGGQPATVECDGLTASGDLTTNRAVMAQVRKSGEHARLVLLMRCGRCGYESPIETEAGRLERECYCCGATNVVHRDEITVIAGTERIKV